MDHLIFVRKAYIPNFRPLVPFLHVKKFVVGGGWVGVKVDFSVKLRPKLNNNLSPPSKKEDSNLYQVKHPGIGIGLKHVHYQDSWYWARFIFNIKTWYWS